MDIVEEKITNLIKKENAIFMLIYSSVPQHANDVIEDLYKLNGTIRFSRKDAARITLLPGLQWLKICL